MELDWKTIPAAGLPPAGSEVIAELWSGETVSARVIHAAAYPEGPGLSGVGLALEGVSLPAVKRWRLAGWAPPAGWEKAAEIIMERARQVDVLGFDAGHDDCHARGELARAAVCYLQSACGFTPDAWPFEWRFRPSADRRRDLVKAAALILAELERLERAPHPDDVSGI